MKCRRCDVEFVQKRRAVFCSAACREADAESRKSPTRRFSIPQAAVGAMSEILVAADLFKRGYYVFRALASTGPFDLIAYRDGDCLRVEVKTGRRAANGAVVALPHAHAEHDTMAVVIDESEVEYIGRQPADYGSGTPRHVPTCDPVNWDRYIERENLIGIEQLADQERVSARRLRYSVAREGLPAHWVDGRLYIRMPEYRAWLASLSAESSTN